MKKKIFWRMFALTLLCVLLVFGAAIFAVERNSRAVVETRLEAEAALLSAMLRTEGDLAKLRDYSGSQPFRVTVIRENGEVLYESNLSGEMENHATREEVMAALAGTPHPCRRYSETFRCSMTYYALRSSFEDGSVIVLRVAVPSREITAFLWVAVPVLAAALVLALVLSVLVSSRLSRHIAGRFSEVADSLRSLNDGQYRPLVADSKEPEWYAVFRQINEVNEKTCAVMQAQEKEKEKLSAVLDAVAQGIVALDGEGRVAFANPAALSLFGGTAADVGQALSYLVEDPALCRRMQTEQSAAPFETMQGEKALSVSCLPVAEGELRKDIARIVIVTDVTQAKRVAQEKNDFFANASHELKTPLTVTQGLSELILAKPDLDDGVRKWTERIHSETKRMGELIADMLKLSQLEQQQTEGSRETVELADIAREVVAELRTPMAEKALTATVQGKGRVCASPDRIYELVTNLVSNAVNYNRQGGKIAVMVSSAPEGTVLQVADTGIGIAREHLPRLCERFYRVDKSRSRKTGGTGLGLAIVKHICALYGARMQIDSTPEVGTTVTVTFPVREAAAAE